MEENKIVVFGSFVVDLMSRSNHLPQVGETVKGSMFNLGPGGKGSNQAIAAKRAGADISFITKIGKDIFGDLALRTFREEKLDDRDVIVSDKDSTGTALIMVDDVNGNNEIVVVPAACDDIKIEELDNAFKKIDDAGMVLTQLETNFESTKAIVEYAYSKGKTVILNPAPYSPFDLDILNKVSVITPNEVEAAQLTGITIDSEEAARLAADKMLAMGVKAVIITLGKRGVFAAFNGEYRMFKGFTVEAVDTTGAGDAFNGGFVAALSEGKDIPEAVRFAQAVAALSVTKVGTAPSMPTRQNIEEFLRNH